jgi:hypothetical protein
MGPDGSEGRKGILQPKLKYRFRVRTINFGPVGNQAYFTQQVMTVDKPKLQQEEVKIDAYNSIAYVAGKHAWQTLQVKLRDDITNSVAALVGYQMQKQVNHYEQTSPSAGVNYKFDMYIETMDGGNVTVLEQWYLEGCWITETSSEGLDYAEGTGVQTIELTVRFDNATSTQLMDPAPVLTSVGGTLTGA